MEHLLHINAIGVVVILAANFTKSTEENVT